MQCKLFFRIRSERNPRVAVFILETEISAINFLLSLENISAFLLCSGTGWLRLCVPRGTIGVFMQCKLFFRIRSERNPRERTQLSEVNRKRSSQIIYQSRKGFVNYLWVD